jgi:serine/threonine-protein kinase RsbW
MRRRPLVDKASVSEVRKRLREELESSGADPDLAFDCLVALTEACSNAYLHGHSEDTVDRPPLVEWEIDGRHATFIVRDFSNHGWDRTSYPSIPVDAEMTAPETRVGGLGLKLMTDLMDTVDIERTESGTTVTLTKSLQANAFSGAS